MGKRIIVGILLLSTGLLRGIAQDTLPGFKVADKGNGRVIISWKNNFETMNQVVVQRSYDSLKKFSSIYSAPSPELPENGYTDQIKPGVKVYYRIFFVLQGGAYFFSASKSPGAGIPVATIIDTKRDKVTENISEKIHIPEKKFLIKLPDQSIRIIIDGEYTRFKDSILRKTKDTLILLQKDTIEVRPYIQPYVWTSSVFVYTDKAGYIVVDLPEAHNKKYDLKIMEMDDKPVLHLKNIRQKYLKIDKANFYHAGWYKIELLEDGKIKDRNKILVPTDF